MPTGNVPTTVELAMDKMWKLKVEGAVGTMGSWGFQHDEIGRYFGLVVGSTPGEGRVLADVLLRSLDDDRKGRVQLVLDTNGYLGMWQAPEGMERNDWFGLGMPEVGHPEKTIRSAFTSGDPEDIKLLDKFLSHIGD